MVHEASSTGVLAAKSVMVTGASRGIGAACASACAAAGAAHVTLIGRDGEALEETLESVRGAGAEGRAVVRDLTRADELAGLADDAGDVDVLIASAGTNCPQPFLEVDRATFDELFALNVRAAFFTAQHVARVMAKRRGGVIVFISSQMGHVGAPNRSVYCATKHAIEGMTKALGLELAAANIRVVSVAPTFVRTAMTAAQLDDSEIAPQLLARIPAGRFATAREVAEAVVFAASEAAGMMTGTSLVLDGGWTAQ